MNDSHLLTPLTRTNCNNNLLNNFSIRQTEIQSSINLGTLQNNPIEGQIAEDRSGKLSGDEISTICMDKFADIVFVPCGYK